jgi:hypothetical protein
MLLFLNVSVSLSVVSATVNRAIHGTLPDAGATLLDALITAYKYSTFDSVLQTSLGTFVAHSTRLCTRQHDNYVMHAPAIARIMS